MLYSFLIKLAMLVLTMGMVLWIGWTVPQSRHIETGNTSELSLRQESPIHSTAPLAVSEAAFTPTQPQHVEKLDLNRATEQDLEALPGIGPVLAERIVEYRQAHGAFRDVEQLRLVKGIGKKKFYRIRSLVGVISPPTPTRGSRKAT